MMFFYYFVKNLVTNEERMWYSEEHLGEPNDLFIMDYEMWVILDYAVEWENVDEPEDY